MTVHVAEYLFNRLAAIGVRSVQGVPGICFGLLVIGLTYLRGL